MQCPKCNGDTRVIDNTHTPDNLVHRKRKCLVCSHTFYTTETIASGTLDKVLSDWTEYNRSYVYRRRKHET